MLRWLRAERAHLRLPRTTRYCHYLSGLIYLCHWCMAHALMTWQDYEYWWLAYRYFVSLSLLLASLPLFLLLPLIIILTQYLLVEGACRYGNTLHWLIRRRYHIGFELSAAAFRSLYFASLFQEISADTELISWHSEIAFIADAFCRWTISRRWIVALTFCARLSDWLLSISFVWCCLLYLALLIITLLLIIARGR